MSINNVNNDGLVDFDGINFYYSNITSDEGKLYKKSADFKHTEKLSDVNNVEYITIKDKFIYYLSENKIYKLDLNTNENEIIFTHNDDYEGISDMAIIDNNMFFSTNDEDSIQYIMNLDTFTIKKLYDDAFGFIINDNIIYYSGNKDFGVYSFDLNTNKSLKLVDCNADYLLIKDNILYYHDNTNFYDLNISNTPPTKSIIKTNGMDHISVDAYNILSNNLICSKFDLFKINLTTGQIITIQDIMADKINIVNNEIWFRGYEDDEFKLYKTDINGESLMIIE